MNRTELFVAVLTVVCLAGALLSTTAAPAHTIRIGLLGPTTDEDFDGALVFQDYVQSRANGDLTVEIFPSAQFCSNARECIDGLKSGVLDVFMTTIGGVGNVYPPAQVFDLPYLFRDDDVAECVFDGPVIDELRRDVLATGAGMRLMVVSNTGGWRNFATTSRAVKKPADLKGLKLRTTSAPIQQELVEQLGAFATPVPWSELYTAVATGVVEGTKNSVQDLVGMNFHEHVKHIIIDGHAYMGALWWYSEVRWQQLSEAHQRVVIEGFHRLRLVTRALPIRRQIEAYRKFSEAGGSVYVPTLHEKAEFRTATEGLREWFAERYGKTWLQRVDAAVKTCEQDIDARYKRLGSGG
ncbi:MAG: TRAP transporter substrate-binding protein DctP [Myxococcota bacterium]